MTPAETDFYRYLNAAVHRGMHLLGDKSTVTFKDGHVALVSFIGGRPEEIMWMKNAAEAIDLVTLPAGYASLGRGGETVISLRTGPGDRAATTRAEHHADLASWQELRVRMDAEPAWLDLLSDGRIGLETLDRTNTNTEFVAFTHALNMIGAIFPAVPIVGKVHCAGALVLPDVCQSSTYMPTDVGALGADFAVMSSHKVPGPTGVGALRGRGGLLEAMFPVLSGGSMIENATMEGSTYMPAPEGFEVGSQPVARITSWTTASKYLPELGMDRARAQGEQLAARLLEQIRDLEGVRVPGSSGILERIGVITFVAEGVYPRDVGQVFDADDVAVHVDHHHAIPFHSSLDMRSSVRVSAAPMTSPGEIDCFIASLGYIHSFFKGH